jgi:hypothetical protein
MTSQRTRYGATVAHVITLMDCGRTQMARRLLETLAVDAAAEMRRVADEAYRAGFLEGQQALAAEITGTAKPKRPRAPRRHEWLRARISDPQLRERTKAALRMGDDLLDCIAEGGVQLSSDQWRKLRRELGG